MFVVSGVVLVGCTALLGDFELSPDSPMNPDGATGDGPSPVSDDGGAIDLPDTSIPEPALPCDADETKEDGIHVSPDGSDETGNGTPLLPYKTIRAAMTAATAAFKTSIFVAEGTYPEALVFDATRQGFIVKGGWLRSGDTWRRDCEAGFRTRTVIASPSNVGVRVTGVTKPTGLDALTIATKAVAATTDDVSGESCIGVLVVGDGSVFRLSRAKVVAGAGGAGGKALTPPTPGASPCNGVSDCSSSAPAIGGAGTTPPPTMEQGKFLSAAFKPADGSGGGSGGKGGHGTPGGAGAAMTCATPGIGQCQSGGDQCVHGASAAGNAPSGKCGCGGLPGSGGGPGRGGGASVALLVSGAGAIVSVENTALLSSKGGDGSPGGGAGAGGAPTAGSPGANASCPQDNGPSTTPGPACGCVGKNDKSFTGGPKGGDGSPGGNGGAGSGGAGGDSIAFVTVGTARVIVDGAAGQLQHGAPGHGAGGAMNGRAMDSFVAP